MAWLLPGLWILLAYLIGAIPFGYLVGRWRGVNIFDHGSGNIGATNVGRVLGPGYGVFVFCLDCMKGAGAVALIAWLGSHQWATAPPERLPSGTLKVLAAIAAFLGNLYPIYLGFRGGKGIATGLGIVLVLVPLPAILALLTWVTVASVSRWVSLASLAAVVVLCVARLGFTAEPWSSTQQTVSLFCLGGTLLVFLRHRTNVRRLMAGTENRWEDRPRYRIMSKVLHVLAVSLWFGSAVFFNFIAAPTIFASFAEVVREAPSDRTAGFPLLDQPPESRDETQLKKLANALAGAAVGPLFPIFFGLQAICAGIVLVTAIGWCLRYPQRVHRVRAWFAGLAALTVGIGWWLSERVSLLRVERYSTDPAVAQAAQDAFGPWHLVSLLLSFLTALLALGIVLMAASLPESKDGPNARS